MSTAVPISDKTGDELFVPPEGLLFRIVGYASQCAIFSRHDQEPQVGHFHTANGGFDDQWFSFLHGSGNNSGLVAIKGRKTGKVLYSRRQDDPRVWHIAGDGAHPDNWFKLEAGNGQYASYVRFITPREGMALFSRTNQEPYFLNHITNQPSSDQYFRFIWEEMKVDRVNFDLDDGKIISSTPIVLAEQVLTNKTDHEQEMSFSLDKSVTNESSFQYNTGFTVTVGTEFSVGIPFVADSTFSIQASSTNEWTWGKTTSYTTQFTATFPVKAGPNETIRAGAVVNQGTLDVPYTLYWSSKSSGVKVQTKGIWHGVSCWDLRYTVAPVKTSGSA
ncbi:hemolytic lectin [Fomes fomentarius]|nr:hemolytic lectin [Fomes fomentarius]